jgi:hypothetical protein
LIGMPKPTYAVVASVAQDLLGNDQSGWVAEVTHGHHKVKFLFAFGDDQDAALKELATTIAGTLDRSSFGLARVGAIAVIVPQVHLYSLADLGFPDATGNK